MKPAKLALVVAALFSGGALAQPRAAQEAAKTGESEASVGPGTSINAKLNSSVDSKKAKPGDPVSAEVTEPLKSSDGRTILPKGTKLVGQVTQASARGKGDSQSMLGMQFEKAVTKSKQEVQLKDVVLQAVAPPPMSSPAAMPSPGGPGGASSTPSNPSMSGSTGGARTGSSTTGSNPTNPYPGTAGQTEAMGGESDGPIPPNSRGVYGIPGVSMARANTNNGPSTVLISNDKNIHLDSGTRLLLTVGPAAEGTPQDR